MEKLIDISPTFKPRPWAIHMKNNRKLAQLYLELYEQTELDTYISKHMRLKSCANMLEFDQSSDGFAKHLKLAFFCRVRLCPVCQWRKSLFIFQQFLRVSSHALSKCKLKFLFLTLTCKSVSLSMLENQVNHLFSSFLRLIAKKVFKTSILGTFRTFEITYNSQTDTYHPHFHLILAVKPSYFGKNYISHKVWVSLWKDSLQVLYNPLVNIKVVKEKQFDLSDLFSDNVNPLVKAACELAKYSVKINNCILHNNDPHKSLAIFDSVLHHRRFISYTGFLRKCYQELGESDSDESDLIHNSSADESEKNNVISKYFWNDDYSNYFLSDNLHKD